MIDHPELKVSALNLIDVVRIVLSLTMLGYASWTDLKTREIHDLLWIVFGAIGLLLAAYEIYTGDISFLGFTLPVAFSVALSLVLGRFGLFGGADVGAFIALSLIHPIPPISPKPVLGVVSVVLLTKNLSRMLRGKPLFEGHESDSLWKKLIVAITGVRVGLDSVRGPPFQYPLEFTPKEGDYDRRLILLPDINNDEAAREIFLQLRREGIEEVWVSNTLPFLVFITIGYVLSILVGDIALSLLSRVIR
jgi:preflagellin peptidase FlaK